MTSRHSRPVSSLWAAAVAFALTLALFAGTAKAAARTARLLPVEAVNLEPGEVAAIGALFAAAYAEITGARVETTSAAAAMNVELDAAAGALLPTEPDSAELLWINAIRLTQNIMLRTELRSAEGAVIFGASMTAAGLDDIQPVVKRLAEALARRESVVATRHSDTITNEEGEEPNRIFVDKLFGFKVEFVIPLAINARYAPQVGLSFVGRFEGERYLIEFGGGVLVPTTNNNPATIASGGMLGEIGAFYVFGNENIGGYLGGGISPRLMFGSGNVGVRLLPYLKGGVTFFRFSTTRLFADFKVAQNVIPDTEVVYNYDSYG